LKLERKRDSSLNGRGEVQGTKNWREAWRAAVEIVGGGQWRAAAEKEPARGRRKRRVGGK
jgi:hypothetical protein